MKTRIRTLVALLGVTTMFSVATALTAEQTAGFVGVVGNWRNVDDGGAAFKVDTTGWTGTTPRAALESVSRSLFATVNDTFITNGTAAQAFPLAVHTDTKDFTKGTLRVQFKLVGGAADRTAGIAFSLKPNGEYYFARYNTLDGNVAVWRYRNGARERVAQGETKVQLPMNTWHDLTVTIDGSKLTATVNGGVLKYEHVMTEPVGGRVGLWTKRDAVTVFRSFRVTH